MTSRERQVLELIRKDPMLSQEEIAAMIGIKRSSVSVYISNLLRDGHIKGRGYIFDKESYCVVIGATNMDVVATCDRRIERSSNNVGKTHFSPGGIARNIAENLVRLGIPVKLISCLGADMVGRQLLEDMKTLGIDTTECMIRDNAATTLYVEMRDPFDGKPYGLTNSSMTDQIGASYIEQKQNVLNNADCIVVDSNLPLETIEYILTHFDASKVVCAIGSETSAVRVSSFIHRFGQIKMSSFEAAVLTNSDYASTARKICQRLNAQGVKECYVTAENHGSIWLCGDKHISVYRIKPGNNPIASVGERDAFTAGLIYAKMKGLDTKDGIEFAFACSTLVQEYKGSADKILNTESVFKRVNTLCGEFQNIEQ